MAMIFGYDAADRRDGGPVVLDPDLDRRLVASAGALLQLAVIAGMMSAWLLGERPAWIGRQWIRAGAGPGSRIGEALGDWPWARSPSPVSPRSPSSCFGPSPGFGDIHGPCQPASSGPNTETTGTLLPIVAMSALIPLAERSQRSS